MSIAYKIDRHQFSFKIISSSIFLRPFGGWLQLPWGRSSCSSWLRPRSWWQRRACSQTENLTLLWLFSSLTCLACIQLHDCTIVRRKKLPMDIIWQFKTIFFKPWHGGWRWCRMYFLQRSTSWPSCTCWPPSHSTPAPRPACSHLFDKRTWVLGCIGNLTPQTEKFVKDIGWGDYGLVCYLSLMVSFNEHTRSLDIVTKPTAQLIQIASPYSVMIWVANTLG